MWPQVFIFFIQSPNENFRLFLVLSTFTARPSKYETTSKKNCHVSQSGHGYPQYIRPSCQRLRDVVVHSHWKGRRKVLRSRGVRFLTYSLDDTFVKFHKTRSTHVQFPSCNDCYFLFLGKKFGIY